MSSGIPHGVDRSFYVGKQCPAFNGGQCPIAACFQREACYQSYCAVYDEVAALPRAQSRGKSGELASLEDFRRCSIIPLEASCDHHPPLDWSPDHTGWTPVMNDVKDCLLDEGQAYVSTPADCATAAAAVLGWTPTHLRMLPKDDQPFGCHWMGDELTFNVVGLQGSVATASDEDALEGRRQSICRVDD